MTDHCAPRLAARMLAARMLAAPLLAAGPLASLLFAPAGSAAAAATGVAAATALGLGLLQRGQRDQRGALGVTDPLTGLPDRLSLRAALGRALGRPGDGFALCCLDIDRLRLVNATEGHATGDALLREAARRLRGGVRAGDLVVRLGGDEFAVLLNGVASLAEAGILADRLIGVLSDPFSLGAARVGVAASAGVVLAGFAGVSPTADAAGIDRLIDNAELALAQAKRDGGGVWRGFKPEWEDRARTRTVLEADLRRALERDELDLHYQPLVNVLGQRVAGFEALLRWRHPVRGQVSPAVFIPLAEEAGLIVEIGTWALRTACAEAARWPGGAHVAVNLSPLQVVATLPETVLAALHDSGLPGDRLELEITESVLLDPTGAVLTALRLLHGLGVRIALDDFGTGYSSLSYLRSFPFDTLKIDRSFISALDRPGESDAIVRAIVAMGSSLGMSITAEGVETAEQLDHLVGLGCTHLQGFFFSPPRPAIEVPRLLATRAVVPAAGGSAVNIDSCTALRQDLTPGPATSCSG